MLHQMRRVVGIRPFEPLVPTQKEFSPLFEVNSGGSSLTLVMSQDSSSLEYRLEAALPQPQAEVYIVEVDRESGVEAANCIEIGSPHGQTGAGNRRNLARQVQPRPVWAACEETAGVARSAHLPGHQSRVLDRSVVVNQFRTNRA